MTVAEMIAQLQKLPPDLRIMIQPPIGFGLSLEEPSISAPRKIEIPRSSFDAKEEWFIGILIGGEDDIL